MPERHPLEAMAARGHPAAHFLGPPAPPWAASQTIPVRAASAWPTCAPQRSTVPATGAAAVGPPVGCTIARLPSCFAPGPPMQQGDVTQITGPPRLPDALRTPPPSPAPQASCNDPGYAAGHAVPGPVPGWSRVRWWLHVVPRAPVPEFFPAPARPAPASLAARAWGNPSRRTRPHPRRTSPTRTSGSKRWAGHGCSLGPVRRPTQHHSHARRPGPRRDPRCRVILHSSRGHGARTRPTRGCPPPMPSVPVPASMVIPRSAACPHPPCRPIRCNTACFPAILPPPQPRQDRARCP